VADALTDAGIVYQREVTFGSYRVDFIIASENTITIIEVDENGHKRRSYCAEMERMQHCTSALLKQAKETDSKGRIRNKFQWPEKSIEQITWIRFNPHEHSRAPCEPYIPIEQRLPLLVEVTKMAMQFTKKGARIVGMYYF
jgi:hypothetical protein